MTRHARTTVISHGILAQSPTEEVGQAREKCRELVRQLSTRRYRVELDGRDFSGHHLLVEAMNMGRLGPSLPLAPKADPCDGLLDIVLMTEDDRGRLDVSLEKPALRENPSAPPLTVRQARQVILDPGDDLLHVGGEPWPSDRAAPKPHGPVRIFLQERALMFLAPAAPTTCHPLSMNV